MQWYVKVPLMHCRLVRKLLALYLIELSATSGVIYEVGMVVIFQNSSKK